MTHGGTSKRSSPRLRKAWRCWEKMRQRCADPNNNRFAQYGGRGITVCREWQKSFPAFLRDMGLPPTLNHSIERTDNEGNYEPWNCRWATIAEQAANKRNNRRITIAGRTLAIFQWASESGLPMQTLWLRVKKGWTESELLKPLNYQRAGWQRKASIGGVTKPVSVWAREAGISQGVLVHRINAGFPQEQWLLPAKKR